MQLELNQSHPFPARRDNSQRGGRGFEAYAVHHYSQQVDLGRGAVVGSLPVLARELFATQKLTFAYPLGNCE
jgi:hypothetical protein